MAARFWIIGASLAIFGLAQAVEAGETMNEDELSSIGLQVYKPSRGLVSKSLSLSTSDAKNVFRHARDYADALAGNANTASNFDAGTLPEISLSLGKFIYRTEQDGELGVHLKTTGEGYADRLEIITEHGSVDISTQIIEWWEEGVLQEIAEKPEPFLKIILHM